MVKVSGNNCKQLIVKYLRLVQEINQTGEGKLPGTELADRLFKIVQEMDNGQGKEQVTQAMFRAYPQ